MIVGISGFFIQWERGFIHIFIKTKPNSKSAKTNAVFPNVHIWYTHGYHVFYCTGSSEFTHSAAPLKFSAIRVCQIHLWWWAPQMYLPATVWHLTAGSHPAASAVGWTWYFMFNLSASLPVCQIATQLSIFGGKLPHSHMKCRSLFYEVFFSSEVRS